MNGYVEAGWSVTAGVLGLYTWRVLHRGRVLTRSLPPERPSVPVVDPADSTPSATPTTSLPSAMPATSLPSATPTTSLPSASPTTSPAPATSSPIPAAPKERA